MVEVRRDGHKGEGDSLFPFLISLIEQVQLLQKEVGQVVGLWVELQINL